MITQGLAGAAPPPAFAELVFSAISRRYLSI